jgi:hypothetical protein
VNWSVNAELGRAFQRACRALRRTMDPQNKLLCLIKSGSKVSGRLELCLRCGP